MTNKEYIDKITADINERGLSIAGVLAANSRTGKLQFITYDPKGIVDNISQPAKTIFIFKNAESGGGMNEVLTLSGIKHEPKTIEEMDLVE